MKRETAQKISQLSDYHLRRVWEESKPEESPQLFNLWVQLRKELPSNLFDFCLMLGLNLSEKAHRKITDEFFPKLNPDVPMDEFFEKTDRLLYAPRDSYKSSIASAYDAATIAIYPNCKLAIQSAKIPRAQDHVEDAKRYFLTEEDSDGNLILSRFLTLFPEHAAPIRSRGAYGSFTTPARTKWSKEPSLDSVSIEESRSGAHFDRCRCDDVVTDGNSGAQSSADARAALGKQLLESRNLFAICLYIGTPYASDDAWAALQESLGDDLFVMALSAWTPKPEFENVPEAQRTEEHYDLLFPVDRSGKSKLTYKVLRGYQRANPSSFATQQLCQSVLEKPKFQITAEMVKAHTLTNYYPFTTSSRISAYDLGYTTARYSDFTVGVVGSKDEIRGDVVHDIRTGKFSKPQLIQAIVEQASAFQVTAIWIEDTVGAQYLRDDLIAGLCGLGMLTTSVNFIPRGELSTVEQGLKDARYQAIYEALKNDELWFACDSRQVDIVAAELAKYRLGHWSRDTAEYRTVGMLAQPRAGFLSEGQDSHH